MKNTNTFYGSKTNVLGWLYIYGRKIEVGK